MDCPHCGGSMTFAYQDAKWWCNPCLAYRDGPAPDDAPAPSVPAAHTNETDGGWLGTATGSVLDLGWLILLGIGIAIGIYLAL